MLADEKKKTYRDWLILALAALLVNWLTFLFQKVPGYMDAEYYYAGALNLFNGKGFTETYIWNTLSLPPGLPYASHLYWMPLPSILGFIGLFIFGNAKYQFARSVFLLISSVLPVLTYQLAKKLDARRSVCFVAGLMAVLPGVYLVYMSLVEAFAPYVLFGGLIIYLIYKVLLRVHDTKPDILRFGVLGVLAALMHLTRADGILWLGFCGLVPAYWMIFKREWKNGLISGAVLIFSYSLIMFPWYARNWQLFHQLFPPGNQYTLLLTEYNDNFLYPVEQITLQRWLAAGWQNILLDRVKAIGSNLLTAWMIQYEIILLPFFIVWVKRSWEKEFTRWIMLCYAIQFVFMSILFPYAGMRGGFLHSGSAFQMIFWAASASGFFQVIKWWMHKKMQIDPRIPIMLSTGVIFILAVVTGMMYQQKVLGVDGDQNRWQSSYGTYQLLDIELNAHGISEDYSVMINNPPGFYLIGKRNAIVVPNADVEGMMDLAKKYDIDYLILDTHIVPQLASIYSLEESVPGLTYIFSSGEFRIYAFDEGKSW